MELDESAGVQKTANEATGVSTGGDGVPTARPRGGSKDDGKDDSGKEKASGSSTGEWIGGELRSCVID